MLKALYEFTAVYPKTIRLHALSLPRSCVNLICVEFQFRRRRNVYPSSNFSKAEKLVASGQREGEHRIRPIKLRGEVESKLNQSHPQEHEKSIISSSFT